ncbi:helix-turn-helix domain-containing protein [Cryobacterium sp. W22_MBD10_FK3]|uniref:helix-turn-helix domain-containing protein n=1 Tax=Cryobacterium sp. W22_MBD10_FK3 TaxID=3240273 RepID=UPI003F916FFC
MKRDAYGRIDENNYPSIHRVGPVEPSTPWAMNLADDAGVFRFLCFDFDGKIQGVVDAELMERAVDQCDALSRTLDELSIAHVVCQSSGTGGRHLWLALQDGAVKADVAPVARAAQVTYSQLDFGMLLNTVTGAARPPGSPHRDGSSSSVLRGSVAALAAPSTTRADLVALAGLLEERKPALRAQESRPSGPVNIHHTGHRSLSAAGAAHMATIDGGRDPSWTGFMCLLSAANAGWSFLDVEHAVKSAPGMEHYRTKNTGRGGRHPRSAGEARTRLERQWDKAVQYAALQRPLPAEKAPEDLTELTAIVAEVSDLLERFRVNPGRWGATEATSNQQSILSALAYLTLQTGKRVVAAAIRDLGPMAGLGRTTAATALTALAEAGYVERVTASDEGNAAEWRLVSTFSTTLRTVRSQPLHNPRPPAADPLPVSRTTAELFNTRAALVAQLEAQLTDQRHDLFTRRGLGHLAGKLYALLKQHPSLTVDTAARLLGVTARHTATILGRLRRHKLLVGHRDGWARSKQDLRDQAAKILNVAGTLVARAERYRVEREVWAWWQAEVTTMNTHPGKRPKRPHVSSRPLFEASNAGERVWPRYPRASNNLADHRSALELVAAGNLNPESRWLYLGDVA